MQLNFAHNWNSIVRDTLKMHCLYTIIFLNSIKLITTTQILTWLTKTGEPERVKYSENPVHLPWSSPAKKKMHIHILLHLQTKKGKEKQRKFPKHAIHNVSTTCPFHVILKTSLNLQWSILFNVKHCFTQILWVSKESII